MDSVPAHLGSESLAFVEGLLEDYLNDPNSVSPEWRSYFSSMNGALSTGGSFVRGPSFERGNLFRSRPMRGAVPQDGEKQDLVNQLVLNFRTLGHLAAHLNPLAKAYENIPELQFQNFGLDSSDLSKEFSNSIGGKNDRLKLRELIGSLEDTYCRSIGVQFMHIEDSKIRGWIASRMEESRNKPELALKDQFRILTRLTDAIVFEDFLFRKFKGAKSFGLEGGESLIPLLDTAIERASEHGLREIVIGMAHRGRLNVLANILAKSRPQIFREFDDAEEFRLKGGGDVKYHMGWSRDWTTTSGQNIHLSLCFNPSHLEFVNPVAMGRIRAKQDRCGDHEHVRGMAVLIHGDAAFAGQGVVQESLNMSRLPAYDIGGTLHIVINNQIGFTTNPDQARSCRYCTDIALFLRCPIFHVNGENPEAVAHAVNLAMEFRRQFRRDVIIDLICFRRRGHNETDEPAFTQPLMYADIANKETVRDSYLDHLITIGKVTKDEADHILDETRGKLEKELESAKTSPPNQKSAPPAAFWNGLKGGPDSEVPEITTTVPLEELRSILHKLTKIPDDFTPHKTITRVLDRRKEMAEGKEPIDWAVAEAAALGSLLVSGTRVRLTGQDVERGTFSHRHAVIHDVNDDRKWMSLAHLAPNQGPVDLVNSSLSEASVLGFEYGYSLDCPDGLIMWEAQFGDFCNAAQVIIDQFIVSAEDKWRRLSGLVLLLPHGFEGQGPEHSSARLERFLMLSAEDNIQVVNLTTPAQYFHCLRRQILRPLRKPLIVMSPKSLLRAKEATSSLAELAQGAFQRILPDMRDRSRTRTRRILLCTGKIYYDLAAKREQLDRSDIAILRLEQLYPLPPEMLLSALASYAPGTEVYWVQEEPINMGAAWYIQTRFSKALQGTYPLKEIVARAESASPAAGSKKMHDQEQEEILVKAFAD